MTDVIMARPVGFEPTTFGLEERTYVFLTVLRRSLLHLSVHNRTRARQDIVVACAEVAQLCTIFLHRQKKQPQVIHSDKQATVPHLVAPCRTVTHRDGRRGFGAIRREPGNP